MLNIQVQGKRRRGGYHQEDVKHTSQGKRRRGVYHQEDVKHTSAGKEKKGRPPRRGGWTTSGRDMKEYEMKKDMAQNQSVCGRRHRPTHYYTKGA